MRKFNASVEMIDNGYFGVAVMDDDDFEYTNVGAGRTAEEAIEAFEANYEEMKRNALADGDIFVEAEYVYSFDVPSFLNYYKDKISLAGLEKITGVAQGQLSHYLSGQSKPRKETVEKIQKSINEFGAVLKDLKLK